MRKLIFILTLLVINPIVHAEELPPSTKVIEETDYIMGTLMSPYCPGRLLKDCPSGQAFQLKEKISTRLQSGEKLQAVIDDLINTFGDQIRAAPQAKGFGLVAWIAPGLFLLIGTVLIFVWLKSRKQRNEPESKPLSPELEERLKSELL
jgi:cytochrome c-type biogenesis protein CcmH